MLEYLLHIYVLPIYAVIFGLCLVYLYDKFENKQYTPSIYLRLGLVIYISTLVSILIFTTRFGGIFDGLFGGSSQKGGASDGMFPNEITPGGSSMTENSKLHLEHFKTGVPTF